MEAEASIALAKFLSDAYGILLFKCDILIMLLLLTCDRAERTMVVRTNTVSKDNDEGQPAALVGHMLYL